METGAQHWTDLQGSYLGWRPLLLGSLSLSHSLCALLQLRKLRGTLLLDVLPGRANVQDGARPGRFEQFKHLQGIGVRLVYQRMFGTMEVPARDEEVMFTKPLRSLGNSVSTHRYMTW